MEKENKRVVGYRRVSMREQVDNHSLEAQENHIRDYAQKNGWEVVKIYTDAGISAKKDSHRPSLEGLMEDARQGKFDIVIVDKVDRFFRHLAGLLSALDQLNSYNVAFVSVMEQLDFSTPWGKLMLTVLGILAEIYIDNLRQETRKGKQVRAQKGLWNGNPAYGYCRGLCSDCQEPNGKGYCPEFGKSNKVEGKKLIPHPIDSQVVRSVFKWYLQGKLSDKMIAEKLNQQPFEMPDGIMLIPRQCGHPGRSLPGPFSRDIIRDILKRVFYTGKLPYYPNYSTTGKRIKRSDLGKVNLYEGQQPALITMEEYQKVQELRQLLGTNIRSKPGSEKIVRIYPLSGIAHCGYCGSSLRASSSGDRYYYRDASAIDRTLDCPQQTIRAIQTEEEVINLVKQLATDWTATNETMDLTVIEKQSQTRIDRARELYLLGEINQENYLEEKRKFDNLAEKSLYGKDFNAIMTLAQTIVHGTLLTEQKKLLKLTLKTAFYRGNHLVAIQPTELFQPMILQLSCSWGSSSRPPRLLDKKACLNDRLF